MKDSPRSGLDVGFSVAANAAYMLFILCWLLILFPKARGAVWRWYLRAVVWPYQVGHWSETFDAMPGWRREGLRARGRAPKADGPPAPAPSWLEL